METLETLGKYEIRRTLGKGAMGIVYEGWDPIIARRVAIKTVRIPEGGDDPETEEALARFRREAQAAGRLIHPNIVGVFDYGETGDVAYIVMEYVDGPSVKSLLDRQERFELAATARIMTDLLSGLQFSHGRGVVHRDIKPANIMLTSEGQAKIADFGIARIESSSMTQAGTVLGTPAYMSPEQFMGQVVDSRSDLYSAGVVLYQLLTGERPFEGGMSAIMHKALNTDPPLPSHISVTCPAAFDGVVRKAMAKRPEQRFQSAQEFLDAIQAAVAGKPVPGWEAEEETAEATMVAAGLRRSSAGAETPAPTSAAAPAPVPARAEAAKRRSMPMLAGIAVVVLAVLGGGAWFFLLRAPVPGTRAGTAALAPAASVASDGAALPGQASAARGQASSGGGQTPPMLAQTATSSRSIPSSGQPAGTSASPGPVAGSIAAAPGASSAAPGAGPAAAVAPPAASAPILNGAGPSTGQAGQVAGTTPGAAPASGSTGQAGPVLAANSPGAIRDQVRQLIASHGCALIDGTAGDSGDLMLSGIAGAPEAASMQAALDRQDLARLVNWQVRGIDPLFCPALNTLQPIDPVFGAAGERIGLTLAGGETRLRDGAHIQPRITMPGFKGYLVVDYVAHDGTLLHLYPQVADPKDGLTADVPRVFSPREPVALGTPRPGHPAWEVGPPYGTDMVIAIASSQPLFSHPRPSDSEQAAGYLSALQQAVDAARRNGAELAGNALLVDTLPK